MRITLWRKAEYHTNGYTRLQKFVEQLIKCVILLIFPLPIAVVTSVIWHHFIFKPGAHFPSEMEAIITCAWVPTLGVFYAILAGLLISTVWEKYKAIRMAIKRYDVETFINLRDENLSPLMYVLLFVISLVQMIAISGIKYHDWLCGCWIIFTTSYIFSLVFFVIVEIDGPLSGLWYIRRVHHGWTELDVAKWRTEHVKPLRDKFWKGQGKTPPLQEVK